MRTVIAYATILFFSLSCATARQPASHDIANKVRALTPLLHLSAQQAQQLIIAEQKFSSAKIRLKKEREYDDTQLEKIEERRRLRYKKILSREQFIKSQVIEKNLITNPPVRLN